jgi:hypothetical protein
LSQPAGPVAEWLCRGLQILVHRFDSGPGLHKINDLARKRTRQTIRVRTMSETNPELMTPTERAAEIAQLDQQVRRLRKRVQALVAVNGRGLAKWNLDRRGS